MQLVKGDLPCCASIKGMASRDGWHITQNHNYDGAWGTCSLLKSLQDGNGWPGRKQALLSSGTLCSSVPEQPPPHTSAVSLLKVRLTSALCTMWRCMYGLTPLPAKGNDQETLQRVHGKSSTPHDC